VAVPGRAGLSGQGSRAGEGSRLRDLPDGDAAIWGWKELAAAFTSGLCLWSKQVPAISPVKAGVLRKPGKNKTAIRNLH